MGSQKFGKDLGLVHEAVVAGRKEGAGRRFWSALVHSSAFQIVTPLAVHIGVIEQEGIDPTVQVIDSTNHIEAWLRDVFANDNACLTSGIPDPEKIVIPWKGKRDLEDVAYRQELRMKLFEMLCQKISDMNIDPVELTANLPHWIKYWRNASGYSLNSEKHYVGIEYHKSVGVTDFIIALRQIVCQRRLLREYLKPVSVTKAVFKN